MDSEKYGKNNNKEETAKEERKKAFNCLKKNSFKEKACQGVSSTDSLLCKENRRDIWKDHPSSAEDKVGILQCFRKPEFQLAFDTGTTGSAGLCGCS